MRLTVRTRGDLVRAAGRHGMVDEVNRRNNTALVQMLETGSYETWSWWDLLVGNEETRRLAPPMPRPTGLARVVNMNRRLS